MKIALAVDNGSRMKSILTVLKTSWHGGDRGIWWRRCPKSVRLDGERGDSLGPQRRVCRQTGVEPESGRGCDVVVETLPLGLGDELDVTAGVVRVPARGRAHTRVAVEAIRVANRAATRRRRGGSFLLLYHRHVRVLVLLALGTLWTGVWHRIRP